MDAKGRVNIPAKFRKALSEENGAPTLYIRRAPENTLWIYPADVWEQQAAKIESLANTPKNLKYKQLLYRSLSDSTLDSQGRISLTSKQLAYVKADKKIALVGMGNYIEVISVGALDEDEDEYDDLFFAAEGELDHE